MNRFKEEEIEEMEQGFSNPPNIMVAETLFPNKTIRDFINHIGKMGECGYTKKNALSLH